MPARFHIVNPTEVPEWDQWLDLFPDSTIFHSSSWARVLVESYRYRPHFLVQLEEDKPIAIIPVMEINSAFTGKRGVSLPFSDNCEGLFAPEIDRKEVMQALILHGRKEGWDSLELRGSEPGMYLETPSCSFYRHWLELGKAEDELLRSFKHSTRNNIRQSEKAGVIVMTGRSDGAMNEFYRLNCITRKKHGLPPQPLCFFKSILRLIIERECGRIFVARHKNTNLSAALCLEHRRKAIVKYAASDTRHLDLRPNNKLVWEIIRYYVREKYSSLDFGRSNLEGEGLRQFKRGWALEESMVHYYRYDFHTNRAETDGGVPIDKAAPVFRVMPISILRILGKLLYRHVG